MTSPPETAAPAPARGRSMGALFTGVAFMNVGMVSTSTVATLIAAELQGPGWSGVPSAAGVLGTACGALGSGTLIAKRGKRFSLMCTYALAVLGAATGVLAVVVGSFAALLVAMPLIGAGNGGAQMSRYLAAELYPAERKGFALSVVVWAGTVGALVGPAMLAPAAEVAGWARLPPLAGPIMVSASVLCCAFLASAVLPRGRPAVTRPAERALTRLRAMLRLPVVRAPLAAMVAAQLAMVSVMTMTPLQLHSHGHGLEVVGVVLSAHMVGMFALAPLSGRIADRWGPKRTIFTGLATLLVSAIVVIAAPTAYVYGLPVALFLLGYGWNLTFVGGSTMLSRDLPADERVRSQGTIDAIVWGSSALAGLSAGTLFGLGGYVLVAVVAGVLAVLPVALLRGPRAPESVDTGLEVPESNRKMDR